MSGKCKPVFGTAEWAASNINSLKGCSNDCKYFYSKEMAIRFKRKTPSTWKMKKSTGLLSTRTYDDGNWLQNVLEQFHMTDFFRCMNAICVDDLGFDSSIFPSMPGLPDLKERVLADTLSPEFNESVPSGLLNTVLFKYRRWRANNWKHRMCYKEGLLESFITLGWSHIVGPSEE